jgi:prophage maintenance system killer protein
MVPYVPSVPPVPRVASQLTKLIDTCELLNGNERAKIQTIERMKAKATINANEHPLVLFTSPDGGVTVPTRLDHDTLWLTQEQMAQVFEVKRPAITKHLSNVFKTKELDQKSVRSILEHTAADGKSYATQFFNLDAIIAVGYRVNSRRATQFRIWATGVLRDYLLKGYAVNQSRLVELRQVVSILKRADKQLDAKQVLSVVERYTSALELLDAYDHQRIGKPKGRKGRSRLVYSECRSFIDEMSFGNASTLFGKEKDESFKGSLGAIYQTFDGKELYPTLEEKAANLLYFIVKNHSFTDGNKRIAAAIFLYFLNKNRMLLTASGAKRIADHTLVALTLMIAESKPVERELMVNLVMTFLTEDTGI